MTDVSPDFMDLSKKVAEKFLHTVVIVDDQAEFGEEVLPKPKTGLQKPPKTGGREEEQSGSEAGIHRLDAKKVMYLFASKGLICSVLKPNEGENPLSIVERAAKRADVFILDWKIHNDDGAIAIKIISSLISSDLKNNNPRLRLIIIYTGENGIIQISEKIKDKFSLKICGDDCFTLSEGHLHIAIFAKYGTKVPQQYEKRVLSIEDLSEQLSVEFAKITSGLVSNVVLESMSVLRDNTHIILSKLGPEMDPPYLAHRALLPNPDDATNHVIDIIASEFHSFLENHEIGEKADINAINAWLKIKNSFILKTPWDDIEFDYSEVCELQRIGIEQSDWFKGLTGNKQQKITANAHKTLTQTFCNDKLSPIELDFKFAMLTSLKNRQGEDLRNPILTLGTILSNALNSSKDYGNFWLCLQPRCDCTRIEEKRKFFFLPLKEVDGDKSFDIILEFDDYTELKLDCETYEILPYIEYGNENTFDIILNDCKFIKLKINYNTYDTSHFEFSSKGSEQVIRAEKERNHFFFYTIDRTKFRWISELKNEHAQRIANDFSAKLSRVGLDESEWLRRY
ncbi:MAG: response regulator receiver domain [Candidatus Methanoperedens sp.]|nr:response regulator receiver domain [Candidatus Methanoperedens sp.]